MKTTTPAASAAAIVFVTAAAVTSSRKPLCVPVVSAWTLVAPPPATTVLLRTAQRTTAPTTSTTTPTTTTKLWLTTHMANEWDKMLSETPDHTPLVDVWDPKKVHKKQQQPQPQQQQATTHMANEWDKILSETPDRTPVVDAWDPKNKKSMKTQPYMSPSKLPPPHNLRKNSTRRLSRKQIQCAITDIKRFVELRLESDLNIIKHATPLALTAGTGVNDDLDGSTSKSAVSFVVPNEDIPRGLAVKKKEDQDDHHAHHSKPPTQPPYQMDCEIVQSLAKWKRIMLQRLDCDVGEGLYCDSTSIRKGYKGDVTHSVVADQWDFEIRISKQQRTVEQLKEFVSTLYQIIVDTETMILQKYPDIVMSQTEEVDEDPAWMLPRQIHFTTSEQLHAEFPDKDVHERETAACRKYGAIFICGMGWPLEDGSPPEEVRSPSYDDWNLNGDIMVYHPLTEYRHELSSMGIRVDAESLKAQLEHRGMFEKESTLDFQKAVLEDKLPYSYGGGLGISRLCMLLLRTCHIGEVQVGVWHDEHYKQVLEAGMDLIPDRILPPDVLLSGGSSDSGSDSGSTTDDSHHQQKKLSP
mmetsp:Transcript_12042/g.29017  ORF Transcript_12042/g.29017 Transcript_12042/m.29017 type:complete len:581 (+) Transcript_12042:516-2258(+)|eukprot:CAMPEP_0113477262 /NCGR_PEP_ID=MMETSP0014_2-20120614/20112_1 /TAXON_ID=2857 /ORGANISM="Nitzschia sp." /LENGTH=580 /DNA_ID=CAMNT_0000370341 /DNA_START=573 /DNA_END=2315 /DNA_ORIENTATION=+ /assembly_acc=CAM_ASM_000159